MVLGQVMHTYRSKALSDVLRPAHVAVVLLLLATALGCGASSTSPRGDDPLSIEDVEAELQQLPRTFDTFALSVTIKQNYFKEYLIKPPARPARDSGNVERVVRGRLRRSDFRTRWADGHSEGDVAAYLSMISWDAWSSGSRGVRVIADWIIYLDSKDNIIGYSVREYPPLE